MIGAVVLLALEVDIFGNDSGENTGTATIQNCYSTGDITASDEDSPCGGILGALTGINGGTVNISNCYVNGTFNDSGSNILGAIIGSTSNGTIDIDNCYARSATSSSESTIGHKAFIGIEDNSTLGTFSSCGHSSGSSWNESGNLTGIGTIWDDTLSPYQLKHFQALPWESITYATANDASLAFGDPHIMPLIGKKYDLKLFGSFRYFSNNKNLIINGFINSGDDYNNKEEFIRLMYIKYNNNFALLYTGFRGKPAKVLINNGFDFKHRFVTLYPRVKRRCILSNCKYRTINQTENINHNKNNHYVRPLIRNEVKVDLNIPNDNEYRFLINNVDYKNGNPCVIKLYIKNKEKILNYNGAVVREFEPHSLYQLDSLFNTNEIHIKKPLLFK